MAGTKAGAAKAQQTREQPKAYIVIARNNETLKEGGAKAGFRDVPFDRPVLLTAKEVEALKRQREPIQIEKQVSVRELMEKHQIDQHKAIEMAKLIEANPQQGGKSIEFVSKYIVTNA